MRIGPLAAIYIRLKTKTPIKTVRSCLQKYQELCSQNNIFMIFTLFFGTNIYTANSLAPHTRPILVSADWAVRLVLDGSPKTAQAFKFTLGHEFAHKEGFPITKTAGIRSVPFTRWTHEVYCDFFSVNNILDGNIEDGMKAIETVIDIKGKAMSDGPSHPSWNRRKEYIGIGYFTPQLIDKIAEDTKCDDTKAISFMKKYFEGRFIHLKNKEL